MTQFNWVVPALLGITAVMLLLMLLTQKRNWFPAKQPEALSPMGFRPRTLSFFALIAGTMTAAAAAESAIRFWS